MSHTPGPWEPMKNRDGNIRGVRGRHGPESVNVINWNGISRASSVNGQANARLIAAAPDLLEALEELVSDGRNISDLADGFWDGATAAIRKARGE